MSPSPAADSAASGGDSSDLAPLLERAFDIDVVEGHWQLRAGEGEVPSWIRGTYYLNGPSDFRIGDQTYEHWLDGDGAVSRLHFDGSTSVEFTHRFVGSTKRLGEQEAGRARFRTFGTAFEGDELKRGIALESPANVSAFRFADTLLAFGEQGLPFALDPVTLETHGEYTFGGRLNAISPISAHPCFLDDGSLLNFGISFSGRQPSLTLYRFDPTGELVYRRRHPLPYPCSTHDFMVSDRYVIFYLSPYVLDVAALMRNGSSIMECLDWRPEDGSHLMVLDLATGDRVGSTPIGHRFCLHLINAYEEGDECLVVDVVELERPVYDQYRVLPDLFVDAPPAAPKRRVIDLASLEVRDTTEIEYRVNSDFPGIAPSSAHRPYSDFWLLGISKTGRRGRKFFDQLAHLSWSDPATARTWTAPERHYLGGEPVFLPHFDGSETTGAILCQEFDAEHRRSAFLLFDAFEVEKGPIARLPLEHPMPLGFHAVFYPES